MKKLFALFALAGILMLHPNTAVLAQGGEDTDTTEAAAGDTTGMATDTTEAEGAGMADEGADEEEDAAADTGAAAEKEKEVKQSGHQVLLQYFIDGNAGFMALPLAALILGLAFAIERIITLNLASTNTRKLLQNVEAKLKSGDVDGAKQVCKANRSPIASIFVQGLERVNEGAHMVEKSILSYGSVQMGLLEKGLVWISLFIALAPMLGFMGTVIGMIQAFDAIEEAGDLNPSVVAGGIKVALLTTVFGLIVAIILQIFYNYIVSKIDGIVNRMEDASNTFVDLLIKYDIAKNE